MREEFYSKESGDSRINLFNKFLEIFDQYNIDLDFQKAFTNPFMININPEPSFAIIQLAEFHRDEKGLYLNAKIVLEEQRLFNQSSFQIKLIIGRDTEICCEQVELALNCYNNSPHNIEEVFTMLKKNSMGINFLYSRSDTIWKDAEFIETTFDLNYDRYSIEEIFNKIIK